MSKDNLVFALAGIVIGIIIGVLIANQGSSPPPQQASAPVQQPAVKQDMSGKTGLPEGHPPIDEQALKGEIAAQEEILKKDPENQKAIVTIANINFDLKNYPEAIKWYEKALEKDPKNINLITDLGTSYLSVQEYDKAMECYNKSLSIDPNHFQTLMNIGIARMTQGDRKGAADAWEKLVTLYPDHPDIEMIKNAVKDMREKEK